jgi:Big-like domain-containing protein
MMDDPELQEIFTDPAHQEVVDLLKASRPATPPLDPHFRSYLRAKLMTEAQQTLPQRESRSWFNFKPRTLSLSMAAVAAGFLVVLGVQVYLRQGTTQPTQVVAYVGAINNKTDVATAQEPIQIPFSGPVDKNAVAESVVIEPATSVTKQWYGSTLVIIPTHPLAPNTTYTVRLQPSAVPAATSSPAVRPTPAAAPTPVVVHFSTVRAPIPPVTPPSFKSTNVTYGYDNRLDKSGTILSAVWTGGGQLLATRPAGLGGPAGVATPTASATPSGSPAAASGTDVWLMSPSGTPLRNVAPGAMLPSAPASGSIFAAWTLRGGQASLDVRDLQANLIATVANVSGVPDRPAVWLGSDRLAYVDNGVLQVVDLHGAPSTLSSTIRVARGSVEASPSGALLAVEGVDGSIVLDLSAPRVVSSPLPIGATGFDWSPKGDLAFAVQQSSTTDLYVANDGKHAVKVATSPSGQAWSDLNWAPDASSLLLASRPSDSSGGNPGLLVINSDGSNPVPFGSPRLEYSAPEWSPSGDLVLFTRRDDATGGITFQVATLSISGNNAAEAQAIAEVDKFMKARLAADSAGAEGELDSNGLAAYQNGSASLLSAPGTNFERYYLVTVQLTATNPNHFLIGVRTFIAKSGTETGFFEEQLSVIQQDQRYAIHDVQTSGIQPLSHGPTVVSVELLQTPPGQQVRVRFDADLKADTVTDGTIMIKDKDGTAVDAKVSFDADNHLATLSVKLHQGQYQLVVTTGVTDINGVPLTQEYDAPLVISR